MADTEYVPNRIPAFGGLCTLIERAELPLGLAARAENVQFVPGVVASRDGYALYWSEDGFVTSGMGKTVATNGTVLGIAGFIPPDDTRRRIIYCADGTLGQEYPQGTSTPLGGDAGIMNMATPATWMTSVTAFGKHYICLSDGKRGVNEIVQFDGTNLRKFSPTGPGRSPAQSAFPAGGNIAAGVRHVYCTFLTDTGFETALSYDPFGGSGTITTPGGTKLSLQYIPTGPTGTVARRLYITAADSPKAYCIESKFVINDNTTTTLANLDFTEAELTNGTDGEPLFARFSPVRGRGITFYAGASRMVMWGVDRSDGRTPGGTISGLANLCFDGGIDPQDSPYPAGWTHTAPTTGGSVQYGVQGAPGGVYQILSDGTANGTGLISANSPISFGKPAADIAVGQSYVLEVVARALTAVAPGATNRLRVTTKTYNVAGGLTLLGAFDINPNSYPLDGQWRRFTVHWGIVPVDAYQFWHSIEQLNPGAAGQGWQIASVRLAPYQSTDASGAFVGKNHASTLFLSDPYAPEAFTAGDCEIPVSPNDGYDVSTVFALRNYLYIAKERSLWVTTASGDVPSNWAVDLVSSTVGTPSTHGAVVGDGFAIIAGQQGVYLLRGGAPEKISQEIEPSWAAIDWSQGHTLFALLDEKKKVYRVSVPLMGGTRQVFLLDYVEGWDDPVGNGGHGRKWSIEPWGVAGAGDATGKWLCGAMVEKDTHELVPMLGGGIFGTYGTVNSSVSVPAFFGPAPVLTAGVTDRLGLTSGTRIQAVADVVMLFGTSFVPTPGAYYGLVISMRAATGTTGYLTKDANTLAAYINMPNLVAFEDKWQKLHFTMGPIPAGVASVQWRIGLVTGDYAFDMWYTFGDQWDLGTCIYSSGGSGQSAGWIGVPDPTLHSDFGSPIAATYETAPLGDEIGRSLFTKVIARVRGAGRFLVNYIRPNGDPILISSPAKEANANVLATAPLNDMELGASRQDTQLGINVATNDYEHWFVLRRLCALIGRSAYGWTRGHNS